MSQTRVVVLAQEPNQAVLRRALAAGVDAVLSKDISGTVLLRSLELVMLGQQLYPAMAIETAILRTTDPIPFSRICLLPAAPPAKIVAPPPPRLVFDESETQRDVLLSEREGQILRCLVRGSSNKMIARDLDITEATVKVHIKGLLRKIRVNNRTQAAIWGVSNGFAPEHGEAVVADLVSTDLPLRHAI